jgi:hypothetical protein
MMTDAGAVELLDSPHLQNLDGLGVSCTSLQTEARMQKRFRYHDLYYN